MTITIAEICVNAIRAGKSNKEAIALVLDQYPEAETSDKCLAWYRTHLKKLDAGMSSKLAKKYAKPTVIFNMEEIYGSDNGDQLELKL